MLARRVFVSIFSSDEGYLTGNEKNFEIQQNIEEDLENWEVDTEDSDQDEEKAEDVSRINEKFSEAPPVRNQVAFQTNRFLHPLVR